MNGCTARVHGTLNAYNSYNCRCPEGRRLHMIDEKRRRLERSRGVVRMVDATGTHRRIRALMCAGWRSSDFMPAIGATREACDVLRRRMVRAATAAAIRRVYDELSGLAGPSARTASHAERAGWVPAEAWDDDVIDEPTAAPYLADEPLIDAVAVERRLAGDTAQPLNRWERETAYRIAVARGWPAKHIGELLGLSGSCQANYRQRHAAGVDVTDRPRRKAS